jgi:Carboxypeptidase regulatory-like domain
MAGRFLGMKPSVFQADSVADARWAARPRELLQRKGAIMKRGLNFLAGLEKYSVALLLIGAILLSPARIWAQSGANTGQIVGRVVDQTLAAVVGAEVSVRNKNTHFTRNAATEGEGRFAVSLLPLGPYEVTAKAPGFDPVTEEAEVTLGSSITVTFTLHVGANREAIQVTANVMTSEPTVALSKSVFTSQRLTETPSNGGRVQNIIWSIPTGQIEPE